MIPISDAHCHFFSERFFETLARQRGSVQGEPVAQLTSLLGWDPPGSPVELADRWVQELDRYGVGRAALIASVPGDEESVAKAVVRYRARLVGFFMLDPTASEAGDRLRRGLDEFKLRCVCLFPAMQRFSLHDPAVSRVFDIVAARPGAAIFVHCGVLSVGVRRKLGLPSHFDVRYGNPLDLHALAVDHPDVPILVPHFGAGLLREILMVADLCPNIHLDTSSSNRWLAYHYGLTLAAVFRQAFEVVGSSRVLFGTDSSFFPRGWQAGIYEAQAAALDEIGESELTKSAVFSGNFDRLFPEPPA